MAEVKYTEEPVYEEELVGNNDESPGQDSLASKLKDSPISELVAGIKSGIEEKSIPTVLKSGGSFLKKTIHATSEVMDDAFNRGPAAAMNLVAGQPYKMNLSQDSEPHQVATEMAKSIGYDALRLVPFVLGKTPVGIGLTVAATELGKKGIESNGFQEDDSSFIKSLGTSALQGVFAGTLGKIADFATKKYFAKSAATAMSSASKEARTEIESAMKELSDVAYAGKQSNIETSVSKFKSQGEYESSIESLRAEAQAKIKNYEKIISSTKSEISASELDFSNSEKNLSDALSGQLETNKQVSQQVVDKSKALFNKNLNRTSRVVQKSLDASKKIVSDSFDDVLRNPELSQTLVKPEGVFGELAKNTPFYNPTDVMARMGLKGTQAKEMKSVLESLYSGKDIRFSQAHDLKIKFNDIGNDLLSDPSLKNLAHDYFNAADAIDKTLESVPGSGYKIINQNYSKYKDAERLMKEYYGKSVEYGGLRVRPNFKSKITKNLESGIPINDADLSKNIDDNLALYGVIDLAETLGMNRRANSLRGHLNATNSSYKDIRNGEAVLSDLNKIKINNNPLLVELNASRDKLLGELKQRSARYESELAAEKSGFASAVRGQRAAKQASTRELSISGLKNESEVLAKTNALESTIRDKGAMLRGSDREKVTSTLRDAVDAVSLMIPDLALARGLKGLVTLDSMIGSGSSSESQVILEEGKRAYAKMLEDYSNKTAGRIGYKGKIIPEHINRSIAVILNNIGGAGVSKVQNNR